MSIWKFYPHPRFSPKTLQQGLQNVCASDHPNKADLVSLIMHNQHHLLFQPFSQQLQSPLRNCLPQPSKSHHHQSHRTAQPSYRPPRFVGPYGLPENFVPPYREDDYALYSDDDYSDDPELYRRQKATKKPKKPKTEPKTEAPTSNPPNEPQQAPARGEKETPPAEKTETPSTDTKVQAEGETQTRRARFWDTGMKPSHLPNFNYPTTYRMALPEEMKAPE
uniref:Uncharacterized protein n=1 Tax=Chromera velia CCMP2878 TaxID=1169474 RepID=A0A0G4HLW2_9ALVE|eukprot:Cvel_28882.t1-p1 / transcript=Cvel_28882.t1 / gene=Cvel_28882 / organism=Chromera_velia_CCMP2878 / gene_product=hypothetical protein / transcript_product=hypothetical protein / location=Cvel_scaffold3861:7773-8432(+) / protein_length=220 / sequence_SO=supercontig / SO=protein_coding / is_pseudo=false